MQTMLKQKADRIITEYLEKIYGFAVKKSFYYDEAEDLAAEIVSEVYRSLLVSDEIYNIEGYVWRISEHVYAKYVASKKKNAGVSLDGIELPDETEFYAGDPNEEIALLRREIGFLTETRREIVYAFYFEDQTISAISKNKGIPEGTVKWHLNKAKNDLKEGYIMKRTIGKLGLKPVQAQGMGHNGDPGPNGVAAPEKFLGDKLNLNIVYSVYFEPKTKEEIAEELGMTLVYIEDKIDYLEANGFLVREKGDRYTTYVQFSPETYSAERREKRFKKQMEAAEILAREYAPKVREAIANVKDVYLPSGNRELLEAAAIFYGVALCCNVDLPKKNLSRYTIRTTNGGAYRAYVDLPQTQSDPDYKGTMPDLSVYGTCGSMNRYSDKYPVRSWSIDSKFDSRKGWWENNLQSDYDALYEAMTGMIEESEVNAEKFARLRERGFYKNGKVQTVIVKGDAGAFFSLIPKADPSIAKLFTDFALENAMAEAKDYPTQMQDLVVAEHTAGFIGNRVAVMVLDILYGNGTFKPLTEEEKVTANLLVFSDVLPKV